MTRLIRQLQRSIWLGWLLDNPLLVREIRRRMRGRLFSWSLIGYLATLGLVSCVLMFASYPTTQLKSARDMIQQVGQIGSSLFTGVRWIEGAIALVVAPLLTAGLATSEKEKDTFDFLRVTTLRARTFVAGCLLTTACFLILVFACTLPILGLTFIFGGVSMSEILSFNVMIFLASMAISSWGIFNSTSYRRSRSVQGSVLVVVLLALFFGYQFLARMRFSVSRSLSLPITGGWFFVLAGVLPLILITIVFAVAAVRRLYEPNNRLFNYKQYTTFFVLVLGGLGGWLGYNVTSPSINRLAPDEIVLFLQLFFMVGWILLIISMFMFSAGRVERGDEVWRLRVRFPFFQRLPENYPLYAAYLAVWLGGAYLMAASWERTDEFILQIQRALPTMLIALVLVWSLARFMSILSDNRNRTMVGLILLLIVLWGLLPLLGVLFQSFSGPLNSSPMAGMDFAGDLLLSSSPIPALFHVFNNRANFEVFVPAGMIALQVALVLLLQFSRQDWRRRLKVSYRWSGSRQAEASALRTEGAEALASESAG